jgi:tRNA dimethylallyltransferase
VLRVYFILGCTGSGKGAVGRALARRLGAAGGAGGRIVSVDSMKIYRRMDIGTAKPGTQVRAETPHYCIDIVEPSESFSVAQYVRCADEAISGIRRAGAIPLAVGGTSLYVKTLSEGLFEGLSADPGLRQALEARAREEGLTALHAELRQVDPDAAERIHPNDQKRIIRALEVYRATGEPISRLQRQWDTGARRYDCVFIGLRRRKEDLNHRINLRVRTMVEMGLRDEVAALLAEPKGLAPQAAQAVGYAEMIAHLRGEIPFDEAVERIKINTRKLAKKQRTWHRRWTDAIWFEPAGDDAPEKTAQEILNRVGFE